MSLALPLGGKCLFRSRLGLFALLLFLLDGFLALPAFLRTFVAVPPVDLAPRLRGSCM